MDILHLAAPCRNVPVTFTLDLTMRRTGFSQVLGLLIALAVLMLLIWGERREGDVEAFRRSGIVFLLVSVGLTFSKSIPVYAGPKLVGALEGWRKLYVLLPCYTIAAAICVFPLQVACALGFRGFVCG